MSVRTKIASSVMLLALVPLTACEDDTTTGAEDTASPAPSDAAATSEATSAEPSEDAGSSEEPTESPSASAATGAVSDDPVCATFGKYFGDRVASGAVEYLPHEHPLYPCVYKSADFSQARLITYPRKPEGNREEKDREVVCDDVEQGRVDDPQSGVIRNDSRFVTAADKKATVENSDTDPSVQALMMRKDNREGRAVQLNVWTCDDNNVYAGKLVMSDAEAAKAGDGGVNPRLLVNAVADAVNAAP